MREFAGNAFFNALRRPSVGICLCWRISRGDGVVLRLTNHDRALTYSGETFSPTSTFSGSAIASKEGASVDNMNILAITSDDITEEDLMAGVYDDAQIQVYVALWTDIDAGLFPLKRGFLGEVTAKGQSFEAELRGLAERIQRNQGLTYGIECSAQLGDSRCQKVLTGFTHTGTVTSRRNDGRSFRISLTGLATGYLQYGTMRFLSGENEGRRVEIIGHLEDAQIVLLERMPFKVEYGDQVEVVAGCDKLSTTCKTKFSNMLNFRGFPFLPTEEEALETPMAKN